MLITDGSTEENLAAIKARLARIEVQFPLELVHHPVETPFLQRMDEVLRTVSTPYVLLMADDDFYFESWADAGIAHLQKHPSCGVVYGHTLHFEVSGGYVAQGEIDKFYFSVPNPVARWLEHESPLERLREFGKGPFTTVGWYALQRTEILKSVIEKTRAARFDLLLDKSESLGDLYMLERLYNLLQPIYGQVAMLDTVYLARQTDPLVYRAPNSYERSKRAMPRLAEIAADVLSETARIGKAEARRAIDDTLRPELDHMKRNDRREALKIDYIKSKLPYAQQLVTGLKSLRHRAVNVDPLAPDPRFPPIPPLSSAEREMLEVRRACRMA